MKKLFFISLLIILGITGKVNAQNSNVISLTSEEFKEKVVNYMDANAKYKGNVPAIIDFYATWCRPCKMLNPILEDLAKEYEGKIVIYKIDVDAEKTMAQAVGIRSMPTLFFFPVDGDPSYVIGFRTKDEMKELIESVLMK